MIEIHKELKQGGKVSIRGGQTKKPTLNDRELVVTTGEVGRGGDSEISNRD